MAVPSKMKVLMAWLPLFLLGASATLPLSTSAAASESSIASSSSSSSSSSSLVSADGTKTNASTTKEREWQRREPSKLFRHLKSLREGNVTRPSVTLALSHDHLRDRDEDRDYNDGTREGMKSTTTVVKMVEISQAEAAATPFASFSVNGKNRRAIGDLGHSFLILDRSSPISFSSEVSFGFLLVDWTSFRLRGMFVLRGKFLSLDESDISLMDDGSSPPKPQEAPYYQYTIHLRLVTDMSLTLPAATAGIVGTPTCLAHTYLNSLVTAANSILEWEIRTHLNVVAIDERTDVWDVRDRDRDCDCDFDHFDYYDHDKLQTFLQSHIHDVDDLNEDLVDDNDDPSPPTNVHLHYALLGKPIRGPLGTDTGPGTVCDDQPKFQVVGDVRSHWLGSDGDVHHALDERWLWDLRRLLKHIGRSLGSGDTHSYEPPIDNCPSQCPNNSTNGLSQWATIMSSCDEECTGGMENIQLTLGGFYSGSGDISNIEHWVDTPNLQRDEDDSNNDGGDRYNTDPKRVPFKIVTHLRTLDESDLRCGLRHPSNKTRAAKASHDIIVNACPIPSQTVSMASQLDLASTSTSEPLLSDKTSILPVMNTIEGVTAIDKKTVANPVSAPAPAPNLVRQNDIPTTTPVLGSEAPTGPVTYKPTADSTYAPTTPLPTTSPTPYPTQVPSGPPPTEAPTASHAPTLSYKPTSSGRGSVTESPTKKRTAKPTAAKPTPPPTKSNNVGGGPSPPPAPLVGSRPRPFLNLNSHPHTIVVNSPTSTTQSSSAKSDKRGRKSGKNVKSRKRKRRRGSY
mmetsp:Transcript_10319/g.21908  ORF Transcript_10319/g.21908 Transcript_10319/m.21908 type:complete len:794 (+) Transcript_10319:105-2486(+)